MTREDLRMFWQEDLDRFDASDLFREESRRMERYDSEVCPERWKKAVKYVKENGLNLIELFRKFGERRLVYPQRVLESLANAYNEVQKIKKPDSVSIPLTLPFGAEGFSKDLIRKLLGEEKDVGGEALGRRNYALDDKIQGFSLVFASSYNPAAGRLDGDACLYGLPEQYENGDETKNIAVFILGSISLSDLKSVSERRFTYTFGINPAKSGDSDEAVGEFVNLRELPKKAPSERYGADANAYYKRKPVKEDAKKIPSRLREMYENVMKAKKMGLFSDVKIFEIYSENVKLNKSYFMVSGFDVFGNELPYAYIPGENDID